MAVCCSLAKVSRSFLTAFRTPNVAFSSSITEAYRRDRVQLAGAYRVLDMLGLNEGICNHLTLMTQMPTADKPRDVMLVIPYGVAWKEVTASSLLAVDAENQVVDGEGKVEISALTIHRGVHEARPDARAVFHVHTPYATALACLEDPRLLPCHQNAARFVNDIAYDLKYGGLSTDMDEGRRIGAIFEDKSVMIMQAHGMMTSGPTAAMAFDRLYYLERACMFQVLAMSTGRPLVEVDEEVMEKLREDIGNFEVMSAVLHFESWLRVLRKKDPDFEK